MTKGRGRNGERAAKNASRNLKIFNYACNENYKNPQKSFFLIDFFFGAFSFARPQPMGLPSKESEANNDRTAGAAGNGERVRVLATSPQR